MLNLVVGLHLASIATVPDIAWPAQITALLHGGLAWVEPRREKAMAHAAWALAGNTLVAAALGVNSLAVAAGAANVVAGWLVLALTPAAGSRPIPAAPQRPLATPGGGTLQWLLPYVSLGLVTVAWFGLPFTTGWLGRGALLQTMWDTRGPQMLALAVVSSGAALSVLYRAWQTMLRRSSREQWPALERPVGALIAATPFLVPGLGMWFVSLAGGGTWNPASLDFYGVGAWIGLGGMLLWTVFLGYSRDWLAWLSPDQRQRMLAWLRLGWLVRRADWLAQTSGRVLLRIRSILEGEHYLAWALLTALCIALLLLFNPLASGR
jgi:hypothetical protein